MIVRSLVLALGAIALLPGAFPAAQENDEEKAPSAPRNLEIDDSFNIKAVGGANLSPDGKWVAYTVTTVSYEKNNSRTRIWMMPTRGGDPIAMTAEAISSSTPTFGDDGKKLYFVSARHGGKSQIWSLDLVHGGEAHQVTKLDRGVGSINFSHDEKKLLLVLKDPDPDKDSTKKWVKGKPWVVDRIQFKEDYTGYLDRRRNHISTTSVKGETPESTGESSK